MLHNGAEQEADEIDHLLRGETLADRIEMRRVVGGECVIARVMVSATAPSERTCEIFSSARAASLRACGKR
jgi:hypothetical protein